MHCLYRCLHNPTRKLFISTKSLKLHNVEKCDTKKQNNLYRDTLTYSLWIAYFLIILSLTTATTLSRKRRTRGNNLILSIDVCGPTTCVTCALAFIYKKVSIVKNIACVCVCVCDDIKTIQHAFLQYPIFIVVLDFLTFHFVSQCLQFYQQHIHRCTVWSKGAFPFLFAIDCNKCTGCVPWMHTKLRRGGKNRTFIDFTHVDCHPPYTKRKC